MLDAPQHPLPSQLDRSPDLRRALEEVAFWVAREGGQMELDGAERDVREAWVACGKDVVESVGDWGDGDVVRGEKGVEIEDKDFVMRARQLVEMARFAEDVSVVDAGLERSWTRQMQASVCAPVGRKANSECRLLKWTGSGQAQTTRCV